MKIKSQKDFASGILFIAIGGGFALVGSGYRLGTAASMGPGYFPFAVGLVLAAMGVAVTLGATKLADAGPSSLDAWDIRGLFTILVSVVLFGLLIGTAGLALTVALVTLVSCFAERDVTRKVLIVSVACTLTISIVIFSYVLGLQIPVWPRFIEG